MCKNILGRNIYVQLQVFLYALVSRFVHACAQLRGNIAPSVFWLPPCVCLYTYMLADIQTYFVSSDNYNVKAKCKFSCCMTDLTKY